MKLCAKHKAEYDNWSDFGPWRPLPKGVTYDVMMSQLKLIRESCTKGEHCS